MSTIMMSVGDMVRTDRGEYELVRILGRGGMGEVWEALDLKRGGYVAIKFMLDGGPELRRRFCLEGKLLHGLAHQNIVQFIDVGETENEKPFLVLERLYGQTLREKLEIEGKLPPREALKVAYAIAGALKVAHDMGIVHRDLKPSNVFIQDEPGTRRRSSDVKLIDFGVAKDIRLQTHTNVTAPGTLIGSLRYMSPEQITADYVDHRSDFWSLGVLMYEMIQGEALFVASAPLMSHVVLNQVIDPIPWRRIIVSPRIDAIIRRCLRRDLTQRISCASELEKELGRLLLATDEELEIICVQTNNEIETVEEPHGVEQIAVLANNDAVAITLRKGIETITRQTDENHRELMRAMRIIGATGIALILALIAILSSRILPRPWQEQAASGIDSSEVDKPQTSLPAPQHLPHSPRAPLPTQSRHISGCRY